VDRADLRGFRGLGLDQIREVVLRPGVVPARITAQVRRGCAAHVLGGHQPVPVLFLELDAISWLRGRNRWLRAFLLEIEERIGTPSSPWHTGN
jgi:hypothetical protein